MLCIQCKKLAILKPRLLSVAAMTVFATALQAQPPQVGDVQVVSAISMEMHVGSTGKETKQASYTPPPGWQIRRHYVNCGEKYGQTSFSVSTVPSGWAWSSDARINATRQHRFDFAAFLWKFPVQGKIDMRGNETVRERFATNSSHQALVFNASANGEGLFRSGAGLQVDVMAEIVYVGSTPMDAPYRAAFGRPIAIQASAALEE